MNIELELKDFMGSDRAIAEAAWTSTFDRTKANGKTEEDVERLINLLASEQHGVPFETVVFSFWMKIPIFVDRQLVKHRIAAHSGASGRYRTMPDEYFQIPEDVVSILNKINENERTDEIVESYNELAGAANDFYRDTLKYFRKKEKEGIISNSEYKRLRETFRGVLPQSNYTYTVFTLNLRSFANFQKLRNSTHAQNEIRILAEKMLQAIEEANIAPLAIKALKNNNWII